MNQRAVRRRIASTALLGIRVGLSACGGGSTSPSTLPPPTATLTPVQATADWPASTLDAEGLESSRLGDLALRIRRGDYGRITSVLVARRGRLVFEEYFNGWSREQPHTMQSVTKSVVSLLAGLAAGQGRLSVSDPIARFFPGTNRSPTSTIANRR